MTEHIDTDLIANICIHLSKTQNYDCRTTTNRFKLKHVHINRIFVAFTLLIILGSSDESSRNTFNNAKNIRFYAYVFLHS